MSTRNHFRIHFIRPISELLIRCRLFSMVNTMEIDSDARTGYIDVVRSNRGRSVSFSVVPRLLPPPFSLPPSLPPLTTSCGVCVCSPSLRREDGGGGGGGGEPCTPSREALCADFPHLLPGDAVDCLGWWRKLCESHLIGIDRGVAWDVGLRHVHAYASRIAVLMMKRAGERETGRWERECVYLFFGEGIY